MVRYTVSITKEKNGKLMWFLKLHWNNLKTCGIKLDKELVDFIRKMIKKGDETSYIEIEGYGYSIDIQKQ